MSPRPTFILLVWCCLGCFFLLAQPAALDTPTIAATAKGPNQINLTWPAVANPGYGFLVEIQSPSDSRYASWTELQPIPKAGGYTCDASIVHSGARCTISDPSGIHVYNPSSNGIPYWVTDPTYIDPLDGSPAQFITGSLKPNTRYSFRVRSYAGNPVPEDPPETTGHKPSRRGAATPHHPPVYSAYSNTATATTSAYTLRYVSPAGNDSNDGTAVENSHAWRTLHHGSEALGCGQALIVMGGSYASDGIALGKTCSNESRAVVMANPGDKVVITSSRAANIISLRGSYLVVDGITSASSTGNPGGDYDGDIGGNHNAVLNIDIHPAVIPTFLQYGLNISGDHNLVAGCYLHDYNSPDATQNPSGNSGYVLTLYGTTATYNVIRSNHLTRGGHDVSLCKAGCSYNRWLNNIMDGGWGSAWMVIGMAGDKIVTGHNLFEGNFIKDVGQLVKFYKPSIQVSYGYNTVRRNIAVHGASRDLEWSALYQGDTAAKILVYNNTFYSPQGCIFQSHNSGVAAYDEELYANNICYQVRGLATDMYLANKTNRIIYNDILFADQTGRVQQDAPIIIWYHEGPGSFQNPVSVSQADSAYNPPFSNNRHLSVIPAFVDEEHFDFHLLPKSKLIGAGTPITDPEWGSTTGKVDLGAFGIQIKAPQPAAKPK